MVSNTKRFYLLLVLIGLVILTWAPWLNYEKTKTKLLVERASLDGTKAAGCDYGQWMVIPFGRYITSCEGSYIITFWGQRI